MIKLIASDMDGTLLNSKHSLSNENVLAIKAAQERGIHFTIITGRDYNSVEPFIESFGLKCEYILMNGSEYRDEDGNIIESIPIKEERVKKIIGILAKSGLSVDILTNKGAFGLEKEKHEKIMEDRCRWFNPKASEEEIEEFVKDSEKNFPRTFIENIEEILCDDIKINKIVTFDLDTNLIKEVKKELSEIKTIAVASTFSNDIEITDVYAQKGLMLAKVIKDMGIEKDEVVVLGDSFNDYSMFTEFPNSFAMENAIPEIKKLAKYITDTNDNDGVAKAIYKVLDISKE